MTAFFTELQKARRRHDLALCLLIPGIVVLWVGGLAPAAPDELANGYSALFYSLPVIEAILMPVMMAVLVSRLWDMEIKGNTPKLLYTLQSRRSLFAGKAVFGVLEVLLVTVLELVCVPVLGRVHGYTEVFPAGQLAYLFVCTLAVDCMLFWSPKLVTVQLFTIKTSAGSFSCAMVKPLARNICSNAPVSFRLTLQPRV